jgi:hypothetical protein
MQNALADATVGSMPGMKQKQTPDEMPGYTERDFVTKPLRYVFTELWEKALTLRSQTPAPARERVGRITLRLGT